MAYQGPAKTITTAAKGDAVNTGAPGPTPPPTIPMAPDDVSDLRHPANVRSGYGMNNSTLPSSIEPSRLVQAPLAENLEAFQHAKGDPEWGGLTLDHVRKHGTARSTITDLMSPQTREVSKEPYPSAHGMSKPSGSPSGTVPAACGAPVNDDSAARRAERLKG